MWKITLVSYLVFAFAVAPCSGQSETRLLRSGELKANVNKDGFSSRYCFVIYDSGRFHLERRLDHSSQPESDLTVYESTLSPAQMKSLRDLISNPDIYTLPRYVNPALPMNIASFSIFNVTIYRGDETYKLGYFDWDSDRTVGSPASTPQQIKQDWQLSKERLRPIQNWLYELETSDLTPTDTPANLCE